MKRIFKPKCSNPTLLAPFAKAVSIAISTTIMSWTIGLNMGCSQRQAHLNLPGASTTDQQIHQAIIANQGIWFIKDQTPCSKSCNGGSRTRQIVCVDRENQEIDEKLCDLEAKPPTEISCNTQACPSVNNFSWSATGFSACTATCGGGTRSQSISCVDNFGETMDENLCSELLAPSTLEQCNTQPCITYQWMASGFGSCSRDCGGGEKTQEVICQDSLGKLVDNSFCIDQSKPATAQACNPQACQPPVIENCKQEFIKISKLIKILFVIDTSGSNTQTDPTKNFRGGSIETFLNTYQTKSNFQWEFLTFGNTRATAYVTKFSPLVIDMFNALTWFKKLSDQGDTPYKSALSLINKTITLDADYKSAKSPTWVVLFMSDGMPTDYYKDKYHQVVDDSSLQRDVLSIAALDQGRVSLNTIYYGPKDPEPSNRLKMMSQAGGGQFVDTNTSGLNIKIEDFMYVPGEPCK